MPVYGGQDITRQIKALKGGAQIIVGSPGRVMDHMRRHTIRLSDVKMVVLDEADEMLNMGFREDMETILAEDPDHIFAVLQGSDTKKVEQTLEQSLLSNPAWDELTAVREGRYHVMDQRLYNVKPNARWGEAYEKLADILYPEQ